MRPLTKDGLIKYYEDMVDRKHREILELHQKLELEKAAAKAANSDLGDRISELLKELETRRRNDRVLRDEYEELQAEFLKTQDALFTLIKKFPEAR